MEDDRYLQRCFLPVYRIRALAGPVLWDFPFSTALRSDTGKNKARVFASALGITKANADDLISLVKEAVLINDATDNQHLCMAQNILLILVLILMIK